MSSSLRTYASPEEQEQAIVEAAGLEFSEFGVRRANMDSIARRAGVSRSTLYRRFANKDELLAAVARSANFDGGARFVEITKGLSPQEAVVEAFCETVKQLWGNPLLRRLLDSEPEVLETLVGLRGPGVEVLLQGHSEAIARTLRVAGARMPDQDLLIASEVLLRVVASLVHATSRLLDIDDPDQARDFAQKFMAPLIW